MKWSYEIRIVVGEPQAQRAAPRRLPEVPGHQYHIQVVVAGVIVTKALFWTHCKCFWLIGY